MNYSGDEEMSRRYKEEFLSFKIAACGEPSIARSGPVLPYEMAKARLFSTIPPINRYFVTLDYIFS